MRKRLKQKKHSCALCKPHKMHWACRWGIRDLEKLARAEKEIREAINGNAGKVIN